MRHTAATNLGLFLLRFGVGMVFLIFGCDKLPHPFNWVGWIPNSVSQMIEKTGWLSTFEFLWIQGILEGLIGIQLLFGFLTRWSALGAAGILAFIIYFLKFDQIGIRDLGLFFSALSIFSLGGGDWSIDGWIERRFDHEK